MDLWFYNNLLTAVIFGLVLKVKEGQCKVSQESRSIELKWCLVYFLLNLSLLSLLCLNMHG